MQTNLTVHLVWTVVIGAESFLSFQNNFVPTYTFSNSVPKDIRDEASLVHKLLLHSYFEYEFIDIALTQAIISLEKALKTRYYEITGNNPDNKILEKLIKWAVDNGYIKQQNKGFIDTLREIRNRKVHATEKSLGGMAYIRTVYATLDFVNDLFSTV